MVVVVVAVARRILVAWPAHRKRSYVVMPDAGIVCFSVLSDRLVAAVFTVPRVEKPKNEKNEKNNRENIRKLRMIQA